MTAEAPILTNEKELFAQMAQGSEPAFTQIFYYYTQRIYHFILGKTKSHEIAEEIVQEVFIKLWQKREELEHVENYESYIFTMATNKVYDHLRKMASEVKIRKHTWETINNISNITEETIDFHDSQDLINKAVDQLSPQRKKIYILSKEQGMSRAEIAQEMNLSLSTVSNHLTEALRLIKEHLQKTPGTSLTLIMILIRIQEQTH